jgi:hypothetical protein
MILQTSAAILSSFRLIKKVSDSRVKIRPRTIHLGHFAIAPFFQDLSDPPKSLRAADLGDPIAHSDSGVPSSIPPDAVFEIDVEIFTGK